MAEQYYPPQTMHPAEGRSDIAEGLEEEQRNSYSARHAGTSSQQGKPKSQQQPGQRVRDEEAIAAGHHYPPQTMHPAEGRSDIAESLEEEQRNAYSAHHKRNTPSTREGGATF